MRVMRCSLVVRTLAVCCIWVPLASVTSAQNTATDVKQSTTQLLSRSTVAERYYLLQQLHKTKPATGRFSVTVNNNVTELDANAVREAAAQDGTYQPFGAVFDVMGSFGDAGSGSVPAAQTGIQTQLFGRIDWESQHFGYENTTNNGELGYKKKFDFSISGSLGLYPSAVLENLSSTTETISQPNRRPMFQDSFRWSIGPRLNRPLFAHGEASVFANVGQTFLIDEVTSFKEGDNTVTATPVSNGAGRASPFVEGGVQARILAAPIWLAHDDKVSNLTPIFMTAAGYRRDWRFSKSSDLSAYDSPENRYFFSFFITLTKIVKYSDDIKSPPPASVRFGVDLEGPMSESRIPLATRFFVSANLDIMKVFRPTPGQ